MPWIFGSFLVTQCALTSCHVVISKQDNTMRALGPNRYVTERRTRDENHAVRFGRVQRIAVERGTRRDVSNEPARRCKCWHPLAPERRHGKKKSSF